MSRQHVVQQGECMTSIAALYKFSDVAPIVSHADNAELRRARDNLHVLYPGDVVAIPDVQGNKSVTRPVESTHRFEVKRVKRKVRVKVHDGNGQALEGKRYRLEIPDRPVLSGNTGDGGLVEHDVPATTDSAVLSVWTSDDHEAPTLVWELAIGHLDPIETPTGVKGALAALGYTVTFDDRLDDEETIASICDFQARRGIEVTGEIDDDTRRELSRVHVAE
jgi:N-acetylmuramoyl-L-alanine amidase